MKRSPRKARKKPDDLKPKAERPASPPKGARPRERARIHINLDALREVLGVRSIVEAMSRKAAGTPSVNAAQLWRYFTTSVYKSGDIPVIAAREALQNSVDAIRAAVRAKQIGEKDGRFQVYWDDLSRTLTFADNGIGMDAETILSKFLSLGDSGKAAADDSDQAAGGFGVAKAVILGVSETFRWQLTTRDNLAVSEGAGREIEVFDTLPRQGTEILLYEVARRWDSRYDYGRGVEVSLSERLREMLAVCDLPTISLSLNGRPVTPAFNRRGGSRILTGAWGAGTTATVRAYRRADLEGRFYVRLGGLFQFVEDSGARLPADIVVDLSTTLRPGNPAYPLTASRQELQGEAQYAFQQLREQVERENASVGTERDYDILLPASDGTSGAEASQPALADPALRKSLEEAAAALRDYSAALRAQKRQTPEVTSSAPPGPAPKTPAEPSPPPPAPAEPPAFDPGTASEPLDKLATTLTSLATEPPAPPRPPDPPKQRGPQNPFGALAGLRISKKNYDRRRAARFVRTAARAMPLLVLWDAALRLVADALRLRLAFKPGFVLDDTVNALAAVESLGTDAKQYVVYVHPDTFRAVIEAHRSRPLSIAYWLHALACHELTHLYRGFSTGHGEQFVSTREEVGRASSPYLLPLAELVVKVLQLPAGICQRAHAVSKKGGAPPDVVSLVGRRIVAGLTGSQRRLVATWLRENQPLLRLVAEGVRRTSEE